MNLEIIFFYLKTIEMCRGLYFGRRTTFSGIKYKFLRIVADIWGDKYRITMMTFHIKKQKDWGAISP